MELYKTIIQGKLLYSNPNSFAKALKMYELRVETYYKNDIIFEADDIFDEAKLTLEIPRLVRQLYDKTFKNTVTLLEYCSQFAISGFVDAWLIQDGKITIYKHLEPISDKIAVKEYIKGRDLVNEKGKEQEAIDALNKAIEKYDNHAMAYERRAKVNFKLKKFHDAKRDYGKSIGIDDTNATPFLGRAEVLMQEENWQDAIDDLEKAIKLSVALQAIYWHARRLKAVCHMNVNEFEKAEFDLKLFTNRKFTEDNPNLKWLPWAYYQYAEVLMELEKYDEALEQYIKASEEDTPEIKGIPKSQIIRKRALAKKELGKNGVLSDLKQASELGDKIAKKLLKELS